MSNRPDSFMPLFIGDYLADTMRLTRDQHGGYLLLIMDYWRSGEAPPDDDNILATITKSTPAEWKKLRAILAKFFTIEDGLWKHKRIEIEMQKAAENYASKVERAKAGAAARWGKNAPSNAQASDEQCSSNANHNHTPTEKNPSGSSSDRRAKGNARAPRGAAPPSPQVDWADEYPEWKAFKSSIHPTEWQVWFSNARPNGSTASLVAETPFQHAEVAARYLSRLQTHFKGEFVLKLKDQKGA
jgi:uncharacterized protein YdaU (DUF1376 family)